jgi:hypothetical protein
MKEIVVQLRVDGVEEANQSIEQFDSSLKDVNQTANNLDISNPIKNFNNSLKETNKSLERSEKVIKSTEGVAKTLSGSINLVTSTMSQFGISSSNVEKTLLKVQSAAAFSTGIKDLTEGFKALNVAGVKLNLTLLANPFVLIGTLIIGLTAYFGGFEKIVSVVTDTIGGLFSGIGKLLDGLGELIGIQKDFTSEIEKTDAALKLYDATLASLNFRYSEQERLLNNQIALLKAQGATTDEIAAKEEELIKTRRNNAATLIAENKQALGELSDSRIKEITSNIKDEEERNKKIKELTEKRDGIIKNLNDARVKQNQESANLEIFQAQRVTDAKNKQAENLKKIQDKNDKDAEKEKQRLEKEKKDREDAFKLTQERLNGELNLITENSNKELDILKKKLLDKEITEETFNAERLLLDKETNDKLIQARQTFEIKDEELKKIGLSNKEKLETESQKAILDLTRKNLDIDLTIKKNNDAAELKSTQQTQQDKIETFEREWLQKKIDLLNVEGLKEEELALKLQELEINKNKAKLKTLEEGSAEYLALKAQINEQEIALDKKVTDATKKSADERKTLINSAINVVLNTANQALGAFEALADANFAIRKKNLKEGSKAEEEAAKKDFETRKKISIAGAVISGLEGLVNIFSAKSVLPQPFDAIYKGVQAGILGITTAANISKIKSTKFDGGSSGSSSAPATPTISTQGSISPTTFTPDTFGTGVSQSQTFGGQTGNGGGNVLRAVVVESEITATQRRLGGIRSASEL